MRPKDEDALAHFTFTLPTPTIRRLVYWYFFLIHKLSSTIGMGGYFLAVIDFLLGPYLPQPANATYVLLSEEGMSIALVGSC